MLCFIQQVIKFSSSLKKHVIIICRFICNIKCLVKPCVNVINFQLGLCYRSAMLFCGLLSPC